MKTYPGRLIDEPLDLGRDGEALFDRMRVSIELGHGFELYICGFQSRASMAEVRRRLSNDSPAAHTFEYLRLEGTDAPRTIAERLASITPVPVGRKIVFLGPSGWEEDVKAEWAIGLHRLNERRNLAILGCPKCVVAAGPTWLPGLVRREAPDPWSVRTAVFEFPPPPSVPAGSTPPEYEGWPTGLPMAHQLEAPEYYEELARALEGGRRPGDHATGGRLLLRAAAAWKLRGDYDNALRAAVAAGEAFVSAYEEIMAAVAKGWIADILEDKGAIDEALRIRREEELPVFERFGAVRERATTTGKIAGLLLRKGETDQALKMCREEELPVFERFGDRRGLAVAMSRIADILHRKGETEEALRIYLAEVLPVFSGLRDEREQAITMGKIAGILEQRGDFDEALRIFRAEVLPVFERLGDSRSLSVTQDWISHIVRQTGELDGVPLSPETPETEDSARELGP